VFVRNSYAYVALLFFSPMWCLCIIHVTVFLYILFLIVGLCLCLFLCVYVFLLWLFVFCTWRLEPRPRLYGHWPSPSARRNSQLKGSVLRICILQFKYFIHLNILYKFVYLLLIVYFHYNFVQPILPLKFILVYVFYWLYVLCKFYTRVPSFSTCTLVCVLSLLLDGPGFDCCARFVSPCRNVFVCHAAYLWSINGHHFVWRLGTLNKVSIL